MTSRLTLLALIATLSALGPAWGQGAGSGLRTAGEGANPGRVGKGDWAPVGVLVDAAGAQVGLDDLIGQGDPAVVVFFMGHTCSGCMQQLTTLGQSLPQFAELGARVLAISADDADGCANAQAKLPSELTILGDPDLTLIEAFGIRQPDSALAYHAVYLIDGQGIINLVALGEMAPAEMPSPEILLAELRRMAARAHATAPGEAAANVE